MTQLVKLLGYGVMIAGIVLMAVVGLRTTYVFGGGEVARSTNWGQFAGFVAMMVGGAAIVGVGSLLEDKAHRTPRVSDAFDDAPR